MHEIPRKRFLQGLALGATLLAIAATGEAQSAEPRALISQTIDESQLVRLAGNTRPEANRKNDAGPVPGDLQLDMLLELRRSPERELAAKQFVDSLTDRASANFHQWTTAAEYGRRFGAAPDDIATVSNWLRSHGFTVNGVKANNMAIDFSGTAGQVSEALHTDIHHLEIAGKRYFANMRDPQIPAALAPAVAGVVSLSNLAPESMLVPRPQYTITGNAYSLVPGDLATIYNLNAAFAAGYTGRGQTIVLVEDTDLYNGTADWEGFRKTFGLDRYPNGSLTQVHPAPATGGTACTDPGINNDDIEAALDVEWASAAAPDAAIVMASCADTTNFGGFIALENLLDNGGALPSVVSISYGEPETATGTALNSYINTLYQTAAAAGVSVFVSSGDATAAGFETDAAIFGINVSGWASTPYNVAVGGTDFGDTAANSASAYWNATNGIYYDSAKSYVPEIPWNNSCGSSVIANYFGYGTSYGPAGLCSAYPLWASTIGGAGGPSACATGAPNLDLAVSGTCAGYAKPAWQNVFGNPSDGVRDVPDLSLFASNGLFWGHYYVLCFSAWSSCTGEPSNWAGVGGTSASSPIMAGIQAVINQALGVTNVGNPNPVYYQIAQNEFSTASGRAACNSTAGPASDCSFIDITLGDSVTTCAGAFNCYLDDEPLGVMSTSTTSFEPAYPATAGWDFATGIGSVNAYSLLNAFVASVAPIGVPSAPVLVSPANSGTGILPTVSLSWNASAGATSYDVYFGTSQKPALVASTTDINYAPGPLAAAATYYWAVDARNDLGASVSTAWSFTTSCIAALNPSSIGVGVAGGSGTIPVTATAGCQWAAASNAAWITITSGASGSGNGAAAYSVAANTGDERNGTITVAGQTLLVTQGGIYPIISTLAGGSMPVTPALGTSLSIPVLYGIAVDSSGNAYFPSPNLNAVFRVDSTGVVTRLAGTGAAGYSGDGGSALTAQLYSPASVAADNSGNVYIADNSNSRIRKVDASGNITTVAGNGDYGYSGDGGAATGAQIGMCYGLAVDASGNLYLSDWNNNVVRKLDTSGVISTVAGTGTSGFSGDGGAAVNAQLASPYGLAVDSGGNLYIADNSNVRIRRVDTSGTITTVAGSGVCCYAGDGGAAADAQLGYPDGVAVDAAGNLYIADSDDGRVRKVNSAGIITTIAGNGYFGFSGDGGPAIGAMFSYPGGVAVDGAGNLYVADAHNARIRKVNAAGAIATLVGGAVNDGGLGVFGLLNAPAGVARDNAGNTYIADTDNNRVRKVDANGIITTIAGTGVTGFSGDGGAAIGAQLSTPQAVTLDGSGNLYIADIGNSRIRKVDTSGNITTIAGNGGPGHTGDGGPATEAQIGTAYGLAVDSSGNLYAPDSSNNIVRKIDSSGIITTVAGNGTAGFAGDGGAATGAELQNPYSVAVDASRNLYIADTSNQRIRKVDPSGIITTVAGIGTCCDSGDGGAAASAQLDYPAGVAVDGAGNLYITGNGDGRVRIVNTAGIITTIAGSGNLGYSGDGGLATAAAMRNPLGLAADAGGTVVVADQGNNAVRLLVPEGTRPVLGVRAQSSAFTQGQAGAVYTVTVSNAEGAGPTQGTVTVTEALPSALTLVSMAGAGWTCAAPAQPACTRSDALNPGSSYPAITVTVHVSANSPGQLSAQVAVSGGGGSAVGAGDFTIVTPTPAAGVSSPSSSPDQPDGMRSD